MITPELIEKKEDAALLKIISDVNDAGDDITQHRAIERYLRLSVAIAIKNGEFNHTAFAALSESLLTRTNTKKD